MSMCELMANEVVVPLELRLCKVDDLAHRWSCKDRTRTTAVSSDSVKP